MERPRAIVDESAPNLRLGDLEKRETQLTCREASSERKLARTSQKQCSRVGVRPGCCERHSGQSASVPAVGQRIIQRVDQCDRCTKIVRRELHGPFDNG